MPKPETMIENSNAVHQYTFAIYQRINLPNTPSFHEKLTKSDDVRIGSERAFGLVFAAVFLIVAILPLITQADQGGAIRVWALAIAAVFAVVALAMPKFLKPFNLLWFRFGLLLHKIVSPLIMGLLFFVTIMPIGLLMRAFGKVPLGLDFDKNAESYWVHRSPPAPAPDSMKRQF